MLLEHCNRAFCGVDSVIVGWDEVGVHMVALDMRINSLGALIVHNIECG